MELLDDNPPASRSRSRRRNVLIVMAGFVALGALLAACGASSSSKGSTTTTSTSGSASAGSGSAASGAATASQLAAFRACLAQQGVSLPTFTPRTTVAGQSPPSSVAGGSGFGRGAGGGGLNAVFTNPADQTAVTACASTLPAGYIAQQQARANQQAAFNSCMADHGVTVPPTTPGSPPPTIDTSSAAYQTCSPLLPARPQGAPSTTAPAA
jgi:hypothetical protein